MDEFELPAPPPLIHTTSLSRKRTRSDYDPTTSSDPALFSSDEHAISAESYSGKRRKKQWKGTWWGERFGNAVGHRQKITMKRQHDSGVFMSDETDTSIEEEFLRDQQNVNASRQIPPFSTPNTMQKNETPDIYQDSNAREGTISHAHQRAKEIIQKCLDNGNEDVDLSSLRMETIPTDIILLKSLIKHSEIYDLPASQEAYSSIEAQMRLYLANNALRKIPSAVFELQNLRLLSLRQNKLTTIPSSIRSLVNLRTLNVSGNKLRYLPYQILDLMMHHHLRELIAASNPWQEPGETHEGILRTFRSREVLEFICYASDSPHHSQPNDTVSEIVGRNSALESQIESCAPALTETILRFLQKMPEISVYETWLPENAPDTVKIMLTAAKEAYETGGCFCSLCNRKIVIPRIKWIEWWQVSDLQSATIQSVPFMVQLCGQGCTPAKTYAEKNESDKDSGEPLLVNLLA